MLMSLGIVYVLQNKPCCIEILTWNYSAGAVSIKKNIEIPDLGNKKDITCESKRVNCNSKSTKELYLFRFTDVSAKLLLWSM